MTLKIFASGDVFAGSNDFTLDSRLNDLISACDLRIANLEGPICQGGVPIPKIGPAIQQDRKVAKHLHAAGFNAVTLANNHMMDYGIGGLAQTIRTLEEHGFMHFGAGLTFDDAYHAKIFERDGMRIGLLAVCEADFGCLADETLDKAGYAWINHPSIYSRITRLKNMVDHLIMFCHAGMELEDLPLPEWRQRYRSFCEAGADFIIGHHPHVPQGIETWKGSTIFYSLGNFYFDKELGGGPATQRSISVILSLAKDSRSFEVVFHEQLGDKITWREDFEHFESLTQRLDPAIYYRTINERVITLYHERYFDYYDRLFDTIPHELPLRTKIGRFLHILRSKRSFTERDLMLLHNIKIESHRFAVVRALELINQK